MARNAGSFEKTKLYKVLIALNEEEFARLGDFVKSPYFNKSKKISELYRILKAGNFRKKPISLEDISSRLYPDGVYNDNRLRLIMSDFIRLFESFAAYAGFEEHRNMQRLLTIKHFREKNDNKTTRKLLDETFKSAENEITKDEILYYNLINLNIEEYLFSYLDKPRKQQSLYIKEGILQNSAYYFIMVRLKGMIHLIMQGEQELKNLSKLPFNDEILRYISQNIDEISAKHPLIYSYYLILLLYTQPEQESNFMLLKKFLTSNSTRLSANYLVNICMYLHTYCTRRLNEGRIKFTKEAFQINKILEKDNVLLKEKYNINHVYFINICYIGMAAGEIRWVKKFIQKYRVKLTPETRENTINLITAELMFDKKEYDKALMLLNKIKLNDSIYYLYTQVLMLKIFYETNQPEPLISMIDSFKHYIKRNKNVTPAHAELYNKMLGITSILIKSKFNNRNVNLDKVLEIIDNDPSLPHKIWLREKTVEQKKS